MPQCGFHPIQLVNALIRLPPSKTVALSLLFAWTPTKYGHGSRVVSRLFCNPTYLRLVSIEELLNTRSPMYDIRLSVKLSTMSLRSPSKTPSCSLVMRLLGAYSDVRPVRLPRQLSGSRVSRLFCRCSCLSDVSRQRERERYVRGLLTISNRSKRLYVRPLDNSHSSCSVNSSRSTPGSP